MRSVTLSFANINRHALVQLIEYGWVTSVEKDEISAHTYNVTTTSLNRSDATKAINIVWS